jgi:hypothetical protein
MMEGTEQARAFGSCQYRTNGSDSSNSNRRYAWYSHERYLNSFKQYTTHSHKSNIFNFFQTLANQSRSLHILFVNSLVLSIISQNRRHNLQIQALWESFVIELKPTTSTHSGINEVVIKLLQPSISMSSKDFVLLKRKSSKVKKLVSLFVFSKLLICKIAKKKLG